MKRDKKWDLVPKGASMTSLQFKTLLTNDIIHHTSPLFILHAQYVRSGSNQTSTHNILVRNEPRLKLVIIYVLLCVCVGG